MVRKPKAKKEAPLEQEPIKQGTEMNAEADAETAKPEATKEPNHDIFNSPEGELVVDVFETNSDFVVQAAIAGVQIKDLDIAVEQNLMVIKGTRENPHDQTPEKKYFYQECYFGPFARKIVLPENLHTQKAEAQMDKGMLTIKIPKKDDQEKPDVKVA